MHKKMLQHSLKNLQKRIEEMETQLNETIDYSEMLIQNRREELEEAATIYLINQDFTTIPGIGTTLKGRIIRSVFDGTLDSLRKAGIVTGIGEQKAWAINRWVDRAERELPTILQNDFPRKHEINQKFDQLEMTTKQKIEQLQNLLQHLKELQYTASSQLAVLEKVSSSTFRKSYKGDPEASEAVTNYIPGVFPEWEVMPKWFKELINNYGQTS